MSASPYEITLPADTEESDIKTKIENEWGVVLPKLLSAKSEAEFDSIWNEFIQKRKDWGVDKLLAKQTEYMIAAKKKLGLQ
jgi:putative aldouronate transport system substrate-binding protein